MPYGTIGIPASGLMGMGMVSGMPSSFRISAMRLEASVSSFSAEFSSLI